MQNYKQVGDVLTLTPSYDVSSGGGALIGSLFAVATAPVAANKPGEFKTRGVFELPKASGQAWTQGAKIYWDDTAKNLTTTAASNPTVGCATESAASGATVGCVRLNGTV